MTSPDTAPVVAPLRRPRVVDMGWRLRAQPGLERGLLEVTCPECAMQHPDDGLTVTEARLVEINANCFHCGAEPWAPEAA